MPCSEHGIHLLPILCEPVQLNLFAAASASALVSKRAGVPFLVDSVAQPINMVEVKAIGRRSFRLILLVYL